MSKIIQTAGVFTVKLTEKLRPFLGIAKIRFSLMDQSQTEGNLLEIGDDFIVVLVGEAQERIVLLSAICWLQVLD
ncbi:MAG: hypothetical protein QNL04_07895 [SAR324 cluster bacterium]|nr:hypothetical protein [SAR324 cluster bacterium]